ncbi:MAG: choice-of-anchor D domain-containing protein [Alphaproteobacteria bacterium]|nr:choice-of-anchor D domain-containing protein [Alphaproteobacteria bacterium]
MTKSTRVGAERPVGSLVAADGGRRPGSSPFRLVAGTALALSLAATVSSAQTQWVAGTGNWNAPANWSTGIVPSSAATDVAISPAGAITVTHSAGTHRIGALTVGSNDTLDITGGILGTSANSTVNGTLTLGTGGTLEIGGGTLSLLGGNADLRGTLNITGAAQRLVVDGSLNVINGLDGGGSNALAILEIPGFVQFGGDSSFAGRLRITDSSSAVLSGASLSVGRLEVDGTVFSSFNVNGGALPGSGALVTVAGLTSVQNSTLNVASGIFGVGHLNTADYFQDSGTLTGRGVVAASGLTRLLGGTLTGDGRLQSNGAIQISGNVNIDAGRDVVVAGGGTWGSGTINLNPTGAADNGREAGRIINEIGSVLVADRTNQMSRSAGLTDESFINRGTFRKQDAIAIPGTTTIGVQFTNEPTGTIDVVRGKLLINGGNAAIGGTLSMGPAGEFELASGSNVINNLTATAVGDLNDIVISGFAIFNGTSTTGGRVRLTGSSQGIVGALHARDVLVDGTFQLDVFGGGTLTTSNLLSVTDGRFEVGSGGSVTAARFTIGAGGTLQGAGDVTVTGPLTIQGGTLKGNAQLIANGPVIILGDVAFDTGRTLVVNGGATWSAGRIDLDASNAVDGTRDGGRIVNGVGSVFTASANDTMTRSSGATDAAFINAGTLRRTATGAADASSVIFVPYLGFAGSAIEVEGRKLELTGGNSIITGTVNVAVGATLTIGGSSNTVTNMSGAASSGTLLLLGGISFQGSSAYGTTGSDVAENQMVSIGGTHGIAVGASLAGRSLEIGDATTPSHFSVGGSLQLTGALRANRGILTVTPTGSVVAGAYFDTDGARIEGRGDIIVNGLASFAGAEIIDNGTFTANGLAVFSGAADKQFDSGRLLDIRGGAVWATGNIDLNSSAATDNGLDGARIVNRAGSTFLIQNNASMLATNGTADVRFTNEGVLRKAASPTTGTTTIAVPFTNAAGGSVEVSEDTLLFSGGVSNLAAGALTGGTWKASGGGTLAFTSLFPIATNNATLILDGAGSSIETRFGVLSTPIDQSLTTNNGTLRLVTHAMIGPQSVTNNGAVELDAGVMSMGGLTNSLGATISGHGQLANRVINSGTIRAAGGNLALSQGVAGANGTLQVDSGASMTMAGTLANTTRFLVNNGSNLGLGAQDITVFKDYANASFGSGNGFNARAKVSGSGLIIGNGAGQGIVSGGSTFTGASVVLDFGFTRGGASKTLTYQIANTGTASAADLRGAIQTSFAGGGITSPGLSGGGVTAQNFGPVAGGTATGAFAVTYTGGSLAGQSVKVVNNFDNVADQIITFSGGSTTLAVGNAIAVPPGGSPVNLGNFRVGGAQPSRAFDVTNTAAGPGAERLAIGSVDTTGNFAASGVFGGFVNPGATQAPGFTVNTVGGTAGLNSGTVNVQYRSNGQLIDSTFTTIDSNLQTIAVEARGYALANPVLPTTLNFGTVVKDTVQTRFLTIANELRAGVPLGFQEGLDAAFGAKSGPDAARFTVGGALANLAAGGVNSSALSVNMNTSAVGSFSASVEVLLKSNGAGTSGLGLIDLPTQALGLLGNTIAEGTIVNPAAAAILNGPSVTVGARRVGDAPALTALQIKNTADPIAETLSATFGAAGGAAVNNGASVTGLAAQVVDDATMRVGVDTSSAGNKSGTQVVQFKGDISTTLADQVVSVNGKVYERAVANSLATTTLDFGVVRRGDAAPTRGLDIGNAAALKDLNDRLVGALGAVGAGFTASLDPAVGGAGLGAGESVLNGFNVAMLTSTAGVKTGSAGIVFVGRNPDMADDALGSRIVNLTGQVNDIAKPLFVKESGAGTLSGGGASYTIDLGTVGLGQTVQIDLDLINDILFGDWLVGSFDLTGLGSAIAATGFAPVALEAGERDDEILISFSHGVLGAYAGHFTFDWASVYPGLADLPGTQVRVDVVAFVADVPPVDEVPAPGTIALLVAGLGTLWRARRRAA